MLRGRSTEDSYRSLCINEFRHEKCTAVFDKFVQEFLHLRFMKVKSLITTFAKISPSFEQVLQRMVQRIYSSTAEFDQSLCFHTLHSHVLFHRSKRDTTGRPHLRDYERNDVFFRCAKNNLISSTILDAKRNTAHLLIKEKFLKQIPIKYAS